MIEKIIEIDGIKTFIRIAGQGDPFLILHGWGRGLVSWIDVQNELSKYFQVISLDLPGFGKSDMPPKAWFMEDYVQFIFSFTKKLDINNFYLLGHSFGGSLAIKLATQSLKNIKKLILVDSAGKRPRKGFIKTTMLSFLSLAKIFSFVPGFKSLRKYFYRFVLKSTDYVNAKGVMKQTFKNTINEDLSGVWKKIDVPTLIIWGKEDKITPIEDAYLMNKEIKGSKLKIFNCGHVVQREKPELLIKAILNFLNQNGY